MSTRTGAYALLSSLALSLGACASADGDYDDFDLEFRSDDGGDLGLSGDGGEETEARSGRPGGGDEWIYNGLHVPNVGGVDVAHSLNTSDGMSESGDVLGDPDQRGTAEYIVECALPVGHSITKTVDGEVLVFDGLLGLAPEWEAGACDQDCQEWVTACLLARTNVSEQNVLIWMQSDHPAIGFGVTEGLIHEASWYGNLFTGDEEQFYCKGAPTGNVAAMRSGRTCAAGGGNDCGFTKYQKCHKKDRCEMSGPDLDVPTDCKSGQHAGSAPYHTISTYLPD